MSSSSIIAEGRSVVRSLSNGLSGIVFANGYLSAALILLALCLSPRFAACGFLAVAGAWVLARCVGFDYTQLESGGILRNALLTGLSVAWISLYWEWTPVKWPWLALASGGMALIICSAAEHVIGQMLKLPPMNTGFLITASALFTIHGGKALADPELIHRAIIAPEPLFLPEPVLLLARTFGVICFLPNATVGLLVIAAVLVRSRLAMVSGLAGWLGGYCANGGLQFLAPWTSDAGIFTYNALLVGLAIGSYFVVSRTSLLLTFAAGAMAMFVWHAVTAFFYSWAAAQILSIAFLATTWTILAALRQRAEARGILPIPELGMQPEIAAAQTAEFSIRFPAASTPILDLPFRGSRQVTQSENGELTHRGLWRHAIDFEQLDESDRPAPPGAAALDSFYTFRTAVLTPISGFVVRVVNDVPDNAIGQSNYEQNWGNLVVIQSQAGFHVLLAHFRQYSILVSRGQWVEAGQLLGQCGNSGRSPIPHLHVQCQVSPEQGSPTIPFLFRNYKVCKGGEFVSWRQFGMPAKSERVERFEPDTVAAGVLQSWKPGRTQFAVINPGGNTRRVTLNISFTESGFWLFEVPEEKAECKGCIINNSFRMFDLRIGKGGLLSSMFLAISSVPFTSDCNVRWSEMTPKVPAFAGYNGCKWLRALWPGKPIQIKRRCSVLADQEGMEVSSVGTAFSTVASISSIGGLGKLAVHSAAGVWTAASIPFSKAECNKQRELVTL